MARIGHIDKVACSYRSASEAKVHYWGFIVVDETLVPIRLTARQVEQAYLRAMNNMGDYPAEPGKMEEWFDQLMVGHDIKRG